MPIRRNRIIHRTAASSNKPDRSDGIARLPVLLVLLVVLAGLAVVTAERQAIFDWIKLRNYQAPSAVAQLATQDTMNSYARKIFYVNHPDIASKASLKQSCPNNGGEQTIVLGCYHSDQAGIHVLGVTDPQLEGVEQVTAAHEMLHAAYDRLSSSDRKQVDAMLLDYYQHDLHDQRIKTTIDSYKKSEPNDVVNEMHSIFGTEITSLPSGLEQYYKRYFNNRAQVATYADKYQAQFTSRKTLVAQYDTQLNSLKAQISASETSLGTQQQSIAAQRSRLDSARSSGAIDTYNAGVPVYNNMIDTYNQQVRALQAKIDQFNQLVGVRNGVAFEQDKLADELNTNVQQIK